ncbi:MAG: PAS domain S-box protein [Candidatus Lokiarchaeota archaeon]|nr:PAS domain S-box protein [Candidatus Lokiarchaeota archaeon]
MKTRENILTKEYQALIDKIPIGFWISDFNGNIIVSNEKIREILGYSEKELNDFNTYVVYANLRDREILRNILSKEGKVRDHKIVMKKDDGQEFIALMNVDMEELEGQKFLFTTIQDITQQKEAEKKLKESEERYRTLYKNIPVPTYTWQKQGEDLVLIDVNDAGMAITQYKARDFLGKKVTEVYSDWKNITEDMLRCLREKTTFSVENEHCLSLTGETKYFVIKYAYTPPDLVLVHMEDVSGKKKAMERLKESESKYRLLANNINDIIWTTDLNLNTTYVSPSVETILGYTVQEVMKMSINEKFTPESLIKIAKIVRKHIIPKNIKNPDYNPVRVIEIEQYHKKGSTVPTEVKVNPLRNKEGIAIGLVGITRDITKRKKIEERMRVSEREIKNLNRELKLIFDSLPASICYKDLEGNYLRVNKSFADSLEKEKDEIIGKNCFAFFPEKISQQIRETDLKVIKKKEPSEIIDSYYFQDHTIWGRTIKIPLFDEKNEVNGLLVLFSDVSSLIKTEKKLRKSEKKYREAFTRAEFYKDLFAHDISNLLQGILSSTQLIELQLKDSELSSKANMPLQLIKEQVYRGSNLVKNIRKLSQIEEKEVVQKKIEIIGMLKEIIDYFKNQYRERVLKISLESKLSEIFVFGNELIHDVFENIILNAIKHNDNKSLEIEIKLSRIESGDTSNIQIEFIDNGTGIEETRKKLIFQREENGSIGGMGLGLSLVKKIIEIYSGKIWVENRILDDFSKGSKFIMLIPEMPKDKI